MDTEPDHLVEDNSYIGKRKRSSNTSSSSPHPSVTGDLNEDVPNVVRKDRLRATLKRARVGTITPNPAHESENISSTECARTFPLPPFPVEIVQHIISYLDPFSLGRLMRVNSYFHGLLDPRHEPAIPSGYETRLPILTPEKIWSCSRKAHLPGMPHPLQSVSELDMFRLIYGRRCQICSELPQAQTTGLTTTPWNSGPGPTGVRAVWPFKVKACANCFKSRLLKDADLSNLVDTELRSGLLSARFTPSLHYVMSITVTQVPVPSGLKLEEYFYKPHIEELLRRTPDTQTLGYQTWLQRLDALRQEALTDIVRLEAWEASQKAQHDSLAVPPNFNSRSSASGSSIHSDNVTRSHITASSGGGRPALSSRSGLGTSTMSGSLMRQNMAPRTSSYRLTYPPNKPSFTSVRGGLQVFPLPGAVAINPPHQPERGSSDIMRLKDERRTEIERRCREIDPPIHPSILDRCPAFLSALQVLMPFDEASWQKLRPQLLDQRRAAEIFWASEHDTALHLDPMDTASIRRPATPLTEPPEVDLLKQAFRPVREKLYEFAREYVHRHYANGTGLTYSSAPQFAADVLIYVRQRFYENLGQEDAAFDAEGQQPPDEGASGIRTRTLRLEHMRYVFENSIKPYTEFVRKDLFLCRACDTQGRHFAFEAIIQHFASKHTDSFSRGNAVVYWKAEWPLQPPFEPTPGRDLDLSTSVSHTQSVTQLAPQMELMQQNNTALPDVIRSNRELQASSKSDHSMVHTISNRDVQDVSLYPFPSHERPFGSPRMSQQANADYQQWLDRHSQRSSSAQHNPPGSLAYPATYWQSLSGDHERQHQDRMRSEPYIVRYRVSPQPEPVFIRTYYSEGERQVMTPERLQHEILSDHRYRDARSAAMEGANAAAGSRADRVISRGEYRPTEAVTRALEDPQNSQPRHFASEHREYDSPLDRSRGSSTTLSRSRTTHQQMPLQPPEVPSRDDAEHFLRTFDPVAAHGQDKDHLRSTDRFLQPLESQSEGYDGFGDRRSNISQPRRRFQNTSDFYQGLSSDDMMSSPEQRTYWDHQYQPPTTRFYQAQESGRRSQSPSEGAAQDIERYAGRLSSRMSFPDLRSPPLNQSEARRSYAESQRPIYVDLYRRSLETADREARYIEAPRYRELQPERHHQYSEIPYTDVQSSLPYAREHRLWDPRSQSYYIERPVREYIPNPQYIAYEELPPRTDDHYRRDVQRPPTSDSYHERH